MRLIGLAERALELMVRRANGRVAFGRAVSEQGVTRERIAEARCMIEQARLLTLKAAWMMDVAGNKAAKAEIAMIKVVAPSMACQVIDWAIQAHGGGGLCEDFPLAYFYAAARTLRFADGPDEVHRNAIAKARDRPPRLRPTRGAAPAVSACAASEVPPGRWSAMRCCRSRATPHCCGCGHRPPARPG